MNKEAIIELLKKNILSVVCIVVVLASIIFYFVGVKPKYSELHDKMKASDAKLAEATSLLNQERMLPYLNEGEQRKLSYFPASDINAKVKDWVGRLKGQALTLKVTAVQINAAGRKPLVGGCLPKPAAGMGDVPKYNFRSQYIQVLTPGGKPEARYTSMPNLADTVLRSVEPPTDEEIRIEKNKVWDKDFKTQIIIDNGVARNRREVVIDYLKATENFDEEYRKKKAQNYQVYLERNALAMLPSVADPKSPVPSMEDIWYAQMSLWIQQDVCNAIAAMNASRPEFKSIPTNPVKHLIALDVQQNIAMYAVKGGVAAIAAAPVAPVPVAPPADDGGGGEFAGDGDGGGGAAAAPAAAAGSGIDVKDYTLSPTGRVCNGLYDVVQFSVNVVVDTQMVKPFIQQLQFKQFINVLEMDVQGVDLDAALAEGFEYGRKPVVELKLKCEALFLRDWTAWVPEWVPTEVRRVLLVPPSQTAVQGPMPIEVQRKLGVPPPAPPKPVAPADTGAETAYSN